MNEVTRILEAVEDGDPAAAEHCFRLSTMSSAGSRPQDGGRACRPHLAADRPCPRGLPTAPRPMASWATGTAGPLFRGRGRGDAADPHREPATKTGAQTRAEPVRHQLGRRQVRAAVPSARHWRSMRCWRNWRFENPEHAQMVHLSYFAGMTIEETHRHSGSPRARRRQWRGRRAWLHREIWRENESRRRFDGLRKNF